MLRTGKKFSKPSLSRVINGDVILSEKSEKQPRIRLDHTLVKLHPEYNRNTLQSFIKLGYVLVDGKASTKPNTPLSEESKIELKLPEALTNPETKMEEAKKVKPDTIYEDENVVVFNKPAGLLSMAKGVSNQHSRITDFSYIVLIATQVVL